MYRVDARSEAAREDSAGHSVGSLAEALAAASDPDVCGPTIIIGPGEYELGRFVVEKPTILRGQPGTTLVGSIINTTPLPIWLEELTLLEAPFPGAVLTVHPEAETTLVDVTIAEATGFGVLLHGGRLEMRDSRIERSGLGDEPELGRAIRELAPLLPRIGRFVPSHLNRMREAIDALPDGVLAPELSLQLRVLSNSLLTDLRCIGTGLYVSGGAYANVTGSHFSLNSRAGIVADGLATFVEGDHVSVIGNGLSVPPPVPGAEALITGGWCTGGIQVRNDAFVMLEQVISATNAGFGVIVHDGGMTFFDGLSTPENQDRWGIGAADGMAVVFSGALAAQNFETIGNDRAGILDVGSSNLFLFNGPSMGNRFGLVSDDCDIEEALPGNVVISGNSETDILVQTPPCSLGVPDEPPPLP
jgi:hypothetical protein